MRHLHQREQRNYLALGLQHRRSLVPLNKQREGESERKMSRTNGNLNNTVLEGFIQDQSQLWQLKMTAGIVASLKCSFGFWNDPACLNYFQSTSLLVYIHSCKPYNKVQTNKKKTCHLSDLNSFLLKSTHINRRPRLGFAAKTNITQISYNNHMHSASSFQTPKVTLFNQEITIGHVNLCILIVQWLQSEIYSVTLYNKVWFITISL